MLCGDFAHHNQPYRIDNVSDSGYSKYMDTTYHTCTKCNASLPIKITVEKSADELICLDCKFAAYKSQGVQVVPGGSDVMAMYRGWGKNA